jgi:putative ABC transport system permease protein
MIRTFQRLDHLRLGFEPSHRIKLQLSFPRDAANSLDKENAVHEGLKSALLRVPGVDSIAYSSGSLLSGYNAAWTMIKARDDSKLKVALVYTEGNYVSAGGITLLSGRWIGDNSKSEVVINETLARKWFGDANPIGQYIRTDGSKADAAWQVIGVAADVRETLHDEPLATVYVPAHWSPGVVSTYMVRLSIPSDAKAIQALREATYSFNPNVVIGSVEPLEKMLDDQTYNERLTFSVLRVLSSVALALTLVGLFSIVAYTVDRRMGEFGIRMAIGATPGALMLLVLGRSVALIVFGVVLGVAGAMALTRFISSLLYEAPPFDGLVVGAVAGLLILSGAAACLLPARKAAKPDLTTLLKLSD